MGLSLSLWLIQTAAGPPAAPCPSAFTSLAVPTSSRLRIILDSSPAAAEQEDDARSHWSSVRRSPHFLVSACKRKATRSPAELSSDGVRAERGAASGLHVWEVLWDPRHRGSHAVVGISVKNCPLQTSGYTVLAGGDEQSWGWELQSNKLWHEGQVRGLYPRSRDGTTLCIPKRVLSVLDADAGTLGYVVDGFFLGVAFRDLPRGTELFPAVSSVRGGARIELRYLNGASGEPPSLMSLCRLSVQQNMNQNQLENLHLPPLLQRYLLNTQ